MPKTLVALAIILVLATPAFAQNPYAENYVANGNFNVGDLAGWTEAGPSTIPTWHGAPPVPAQVFSQGAPMHVTEIRYYQQGDRHVVRTAVASTVKAYDKYSVGWTVSGATTMGYPWISQIVRVAPGTYAATASWHVIAGHETAADREALKSPPAQPASSDPKAPAIPRSIGGAFILNTDESINCYSDEGSILTAIVWNDESNGKWMAKSANVEIATLTGYIELRLQLCTPGSKRVVFDRFKQSTDCDYVAFDNISLQLAPVEPEQPSSTPGAQ